MPNIVCYMHAVAHLLSVSMDIVYTFETLTTTELLWFISPIGAVYIAITEIINQYTSSAWGWFSILTVDSAPRTD